MGRFKIYYLICPLDGKIRYIGKSTNPKQRLKDHVKDFGDTTGKKKWITKLFKKGFSPVLKIVQETDTESKARFLENEHVKKNASTLYNIFLPGKNTPTVNDYRKINNIKTDLEFQTISKYDKIK
jgi:predicted GIY-YIG superfamily endonuclease